jgi:hypothetical protein
LIKRISSRTVTPTLPSRIGRTADPEAAKDQRCVESKIETAADDAVPMSPYRLPA